MSRDGDCDSKGEARRRWHQKPAVIPLTLVVTLLGFAFGYGQLFGQVQGNTEDIDRIEARMVKAVEAIDRKLDQLFTPRIARRER